MLVNCFVNVNNTSVKFLFKLHLHFQFLLVPFAIIHLMFSSRIAGALRHHDTQHKTFSKTTLSIITVSIMALSITTFSITTPNIMTFSITTPSIIINKMAVFLC
jgi:hypothetical protein